MAKRTYPYGLRRAGLWRLAKESGAPRISKDGLDALALVLEGTGAAVVRQAVEFASHAGRKTVRRADIELAARALNLPFDQKGMVAR